MTLALRFTSIVFALVVFASVAPARAAGPRVAVLAVRCDDGSLSEPARAALTEDVRLALETTAGRWGGSVVSAAEVQRAREQQGARCAAGGPVCDVAIARAARADFFLVGEAVRMGPELTVLLKAVGSTSERGLAGRRVKGANVAALSDAVGREAVSLVTEVIERKRRGQRASAEEPREPRRAAADAGPEETLLRMDANLFRGPEAVGGQVVVTSRRLVFRPHAINVQGGEESIPLAEVSSVTPVSGLLNNRASVMTRRGERVFVLQDRDRFVRVLRERLAGAR